MNRDGSMKFASKKNILPILILLILITVLCCSSVSVSAVEADEKNGVANASPKLVEELEQREVDKFQYQFEDRPDPFLPFLEPNQTQRLDTTGDELVEGPSGPLRYIQWLEPSQLSLVAIMTVGGRTMAMAEDVTGKGYTLEVGIPIGLHGIINSIKNEQVRITETTKTKSGKINTKEIIMRLKKEGDR